MPKFSPNEIHNLAVKELDFEGKKQGNNVGSFLRQLILGGQDGIVNVLGIILGVATATNNAGIVIVSGLAATFAESISMAAVAYTSARAGKDYYNAMLEQEKREIKELPEVEKEEVRLIYMKKGFNGNHLEETVNHVCSNEKLWLEVMMTEELGLSESANINPAKEATVVGLASFAGSIIPLIPFFFLPTINMAIPSTVILSLVVLFMAGALKAKITIGNWKKSGLEMALIGGVAAISGYAIGALLGAAIS